MQIFKPEVLEKGRKYPAILTGDGCFRTCNDLVIDDAISRGYVVVKFNRVEFAADIDDNGRKGGHAHTREDFDALFAFVEGVNNVTNGYETTPFKKL